MRGTIFIDGRERNSGVPEKLVSIGAQIFYRELTVGDYVVSSSTAIERKTDRDFIKSIFDGRLFDQVRRLCESYENPILIIEGEIFKRLDEINPKIFWGALASIITGYNLKIIYTLNEDQTAEIINLIAIHEQFKREKPITIHKKPSLSSINEWQQYIIQSLPGIGSKLGVRLLQHFKTLRKVFTASQSELAVIIGRNKAVKIFEILNRPFTMEDKHYKQDKLT
ncbi:MAG: ERCC4 domain-containing protein [Candidatus Methanomethylicia archaeon]